MATKSKSMSKSPKKGAKKKTTPSTEFFLYAPNVNQVYLAGDFNNWQPDAQEYRLRKFKGDIWKKTVQLKPGRYEYQFVVDGHWWCDPANDNRVTNEYCTQNCVLEVK
jgi:1,4-alpha-glucan branching enzyme